MHSVVLDGFAVNPGDLSWDFLSAYGTYEVYDETPPEEVVARAACADALFINRVHLTPSIIDALPKLKFVSALGTGYDMFDLPALRARGVCVCNVPGYSSPSVAQHAFHLLLSLATDMAGLAQIVQAGKWTGMSGFHYEAVRTTELYGKTIGLIGYGGIGSRMARLCDAAGMTVLATSPSRRAGSDGIATFLPPDELLPRCDMLSLHCPLSDATRGMVNEEFLSRVKRGVWIVNTARGGLIDESALADALDAGIVGRAALDVMAPEPPKADNRLLSHENVLVTPHCAWTFRPARERLMQVLDENLASFLKTGRGAHEVMPRD